MLIPWPRGIYVYCIRLFVPFIVVLWLFYCTIGGIAWALMGKGLPSLSLRVVRWWFQKSGWFGWLLIFEHPSKSQTHCFITWVSLMCWVNSSHRSYDNTVTSFSNRVFLGLITKPFILIHINWAPGFNLIYSIHVRYTIL